MDEPGGELRLPWVRDELRLCLEELALADPRASWRSDAECGLVAGIDQVIHFLFDDHDFDESAIGDSLRHPDEADAMADLKTSLERIIAELPEGNDDDYVRHVAWPTVTRAAAAALSLLNSGR